MLELIAGPRPRVCMCVRWWIGMGGWCSDWWWWRRRMGLCWRWRGYLLLSLWDLWVIFCGLRGRIVFCRRIVCRGLRRGSHVWSARGRTGHVKITERVLLSLSSWLDPWDCECSPRSVSQIYFYQTPRNLSPQRVLCRLFRPQCGFPR